MMLILSMVLAICGNSLLIVLNVSFKKKKKRSSAKIKDEERDVRILKRKKGMN